MGWVRELTYGVVRLRGRLDHLLDHHVRGGIGRLEPAVLDLLRMGAYQLLRMGSVPAYAAVSQTVDQIRGEAGRGAGGLGNAVLRSLQRDVDRGGDLRDRFPDPDADPTGHLSTWGSHPRWLVERWLERWPVAAVRALVEADNEVPPLTLALLGRAPDERIGEAREALAAAGIEAALLEDVPGMLRLSPGTDPGAALAAVPRSVIQDPAATLVARSVDPPSGAPVADLCAAPGGKALVLAGSGAYVLAADRSLPRLRLVRENAERAGASVGLAVADARNPPVREVGAVLVDAPCTGTGTLRRHPDARWRLEPGDPARMARVQAAILDGAAEAVAPGGLLVYATCTLEPEENEEQVRAFLRRHPEFRTEPARATPEAGPGVATPEGWLHVLPWRSGFDGAFMARLRRGTERDTR